uniref:hypothetical protein n=1 Tax=Ruminococcus flavefaciens TaxID=1265 RepID=UPI001966ED8B
NSFSQREISREIMKVTSNRKNTMSRLIIETIKMVDTFFNFLMLAVMDQIIGSAAIEKEISETEKVRISEINEVTVTERYMTIREWEVNA